MLNEFLGIPEDRLNGFQTLPNRILSPSCVIAHSLPHTMQFYSLKVCTLSHTLLICSLPFHDIPFHTSQPPHTMCTINFLIINPSMPYAPISHGWYSSAPPMLYTHSPLLNLFMHLPLHVYNTGSMSGGSPPFPPLAISVFVHCTPIL